jgi:hypothetical protein
MKVGDLVKVKAGDHRIQKDGPFPVGVITDTLEADDGFYHFEVVYTFMGSQEREWLSDLHLELVNEGR